MQRKVVIIIVFAVLLIIVGGLIWFFVGETRERAGTIEDEFGMRSFFPFGRFEMPRDSRRDGLITEDGLDAPEFIPVLRQLSSSSVAGAVFVENEDDETQRIRFVEKGTGHVFETTVNSFTQTRLSNTTIPKIQTAQWNKDGESFVVQYIKDDVVEVFLAEIKDTKEENDDGVEKEIVGSFLPSGVLGVGVKGTGDSLFYTLEGGSGSLGITAKIDGTNQKQILSSPLKEWLIGWPGGNTILLTTKPSFSVDGTVFSLNSSSGSFRKIFGGVPGLTILASPDAENLIYSKSSQTGLSLTLYNTTDNEVLDLPITTLPEKCVWSTKEEGVIYCGVPQTLPRAEYPDGWFQGLVSFSDSIWKVNVFSGIAEFVLSPEDFGVGSIDAIDLSLSPDENYLMFTNKNNSIAWVVRLVEPGTSTDSDDNSD